MNLAEKLQRENAVRRFRRAASRVVAVVGEKATRGDRERVRRQVYQELMGMSAWANESWSDFVRKTRGG